jgi:hypothetical protein
MAPEAERSPLTSIRHRPEATQNPFRLSIAHLLLWTATTAFALFLLRPTFPATLEDAEAADGAVLRALVSVAVAPVYGAAILGLVMVLRQLRDIGLFRWREPGHCLLAMVGSGFLGFGLIGWAMSTLDEPQFSSYVVVALCGAVASIVALLLVFPVIVLLVDVEFLDPPRWRNVLWLLAATICGCLCVPEPPAFLYPVIPALLLICFLLSLFVAVGIDIWKGQHRDLPHWLGVVAIVTVIGHLAALASMPVR